MIQWKNRGERESLPLPTTTGGGCQKKSLKEGFLDDIISRYILPAGVRVHVINQMIWIKTPRGSKDGKGGVGSSDASIFLEKAGRQTSSLGQKKPLRIPEKAKALN